MNVQLGRVGPDHLAAHEPDRVGANGSDRTDVHDPPVRGRDREFVHELGSATQARHGHGGQSRSDRDLNGRTEHPARPRVVDDNFADGRFPDHDP